MSITSNEIQVNGAVTYWTLGTLFDRQTIVDGFKKLGFEKFTPEVRSPRSALSESVHEHYKGAASALEKNEKILFRPISTVDEVEGTVGVAAVLETLEAGGKNEYTTLRTFRTVGTSGSVAIEPSDFDLHASVEQLFRKHRQTIGQHAIARSLVECLGPEGMGGTSLRPSGGIYWVEESKLPEWQKLSEVVQSATLEGESRIYQLRTVFDDNAIVAVRDAIINEVRSNAENIIDKAKNNDLGERAFRARRRDAQALHSRIAHYEGILGPVLQELHDVADKCESEVVTAGLAEFSDLFPPLVPTEGAA